MCLGRKQMITQVIGILKSMWGTWIEFWVPCLGLLQPWPCQNLRTESVGGWSPSPPAHSHPHSLIILSLSICVSNKWTNKTFFFFFSKILVPWQAFWYSGLKSPLVCQHPILESCFCFWSNFLLIFTLAGSRWLNRLGTCYPLGTPGWRPWFLTSIWFSPDCCWKFWSKLGMGVLSLWLPVSVYHSVFQSKQINEETLKNSNASVMHLLCILCQTINLSIIKLTYHIIKWKSKSWFKYIYLNSFC